MGRIPEELLLSRIGLRKGKLEIVEYIGSNKFQKSTYKVKCDCGDISQTTWSAFKNTSKTSCFLCSRSRGKNSYLYKHGDAKKRIYNIWNKMIQRCTNPKEDSYKDYGGRGIVICEEWMDYLTFKAWAFKNNYNDKLTLDRIDVNGIYTPENCRFVTPRVQSNNRRVTVLVTIEGETKPLSIWCDKYNISYNTVRGRLLRGIDIVEAITTPVGKRGGRVNFESIKDKITHPQKLININGEDKTLAEWARIYNMKYNTVKNRLNSGVDELSALTTPKITNFAKNVLKKKTNANSTSTGKNK